MAPRSYLTILPVVVHGLQSSSPASTATAYQGGRVLATAATMPYMLDPGFPSAQGVDRSADFLRRDSFLNRLSSDKGLGSVYLAQQPPAVGDAAPEIQQASLGAWPLVEGTETVPLASQASPDSRLWVGSAGWYGGQQGRESAWQGAPLAAESAASFAAAPHLARTNDWRIEAAREQTLVPATQAQTRSREEPLWEDILACGVSAMLGAFAVVACCFSEKREDQQNHSVGILGRIWQHIMEHKRESFAFIIVLAIMCALGLQHDVLYQLLVNLLILVLIVTVGSFMLRGAFAHLQMRLDHLQVILKSLNNKADAVVDQAETAGPWAYQASSSSGQQQQREQQSLLPSQQVPVAGTQQPPPTGQRSKNPYEKDGTPGCC